MILTNVILILVDSTLKIFKFFHKGLLANFHSHIKEKYFTNAPKWTGIIFGVH